MKDTKPHIRPVRLGHMSTRNATHTPKKGKGASNRKDRQSWKVDIKKGWD